MTLIKEITSFSRAQLSAFAGGLVDYGVMLICVEIFATHYIFGIVSGGIIGAIVNYTINRYWSFKGHNEQAHHQLGKFIIVVVGSILLKSGGTSFFTEIIKIDYRVSRLLTDLIVSFGFNYTLQRFWVFKNQIKTEN